MLVRNSTSGAVHIENSNHEPGFTVCGVRITDKYHAVVSDGPTCIECARAMRPMPHVGTYVPIAELVRFMPSTSARDLLNWPA